MPSSTANFTALLAAKASNISIVPGKVIFSARAAITSPFASRTTTPIPASPDSLNTTSSKFVLYNLPTGGLHLILAFDGFGTGFGSFSWNSERYSLAAEKIMSVSMPFSFNLSRFLWFQINHATTASSLRLSFRYPTR